MLPRATRFREKADQDHQTGLLVINKIDLAPSVGASLEVMERDTRRIRGRKPHVFTNLKDGTGVDAVTKWIRQTLLFES